MPIAKSVHVFYFLIIFPLLVYILCLWRLSLSHFFSRHYYVHVLVMGPYLYLLVRGLLKYMRQKQIPWSSSFKPLVAQTLVINKSHVFFARLLFIGNSFTKTLNHVLRKFPMIEVWFRLRWMMLQIPSSLLIRSRLV